MRKKCLKHVFILLVIGLMIGANFTIAEEPRDYSETELTFLTWNLGDMPPIKSLSSTEIWELTNFIVSTHPNVIGFQEDFKRNVFDSVLDKHIYRRHIQATTAPPFPSDKAYGNGLSAFFDFPIGKVEQVPWEDCYGYIFDNSDCNAEKGFTFSPVSLPPLENYRFPIHFYNLHLDAGTGIWDGDTRLLQLLQLEEFMNSNSIGKAVVVVGDFNIHVDDTLDMSTLTGFMNRQYPRLQMSCLISQKTNDSQTEKFDFILYRSGADVILDLQDCNVLYSQNQSDHFPVKADFKATILHGPLPDLKVTDVRLKDSNYSNPPNTVYATVENVGEADTVEADGIAVSIWIGDIFAGYITVEDSNGNTAPLGKGESFTGELKFSEETEYEIWERYGNDSEWLVKAHADPNNRNAELDWYNNNIKEEWIATKRLNIESPQESEKYTVGDPLNIEWTYSGLPGNVKIWLLKEGKSDCLIDTCLIWNRSYSWTVTDFDYGSGSDYKIKVSTEDELYSDTSAAFTINNGDVTPTITVTSPNGGENWVLGSKQTITWETTGITGDVKIVLWKNGSWVGAIARNLDHDAEAYTWTVGNLLNGTTVAASSGYKIRIREIESGPFDDSDTSFNLLCPAPPSIDVTSPDGGENWQIGSTQTISWTSKNLDDLVKITLFKDGVNQGFVKGNLPSTGSYEWKVGNLSNGTTVSTGSGYKIRVKSYEEGVENFSLAPFSISGSGGDPVKAKMLSPANGSTLTSSKVMFIWDAGVGVEGYALWIGNTPGGNDIYNKDSNGALSLLVTDLPTDGRTLYVSLWSMINGSWGNNVEYYEYTAVTALRAKMLSPANGSTLTGSTVTFKWTAGVCVEGYALWIGNTQGGNDIYNKDSNGALSLTVTNLPTDGRTLYVSLWSMINGSWGNNVRYYTYTAKSPVLAKMLSPANGSTLTGATVTFKWDAGIGVERYALWIGNTQGGNDIYNKDSNGALSLTVTNLPTDGRTLYVSLWSMINGSWGNNVRYYTYTAKSPVLAKMLSPANGSTLTGATVTFKWDAGVGVERYALWIGNTQGGNDIYNKDSNGALSLTVTNLPTDGRTLYVSLWSMINGSWGNNVRYYTYTAKSPELAKMLSPANGSTLTGATVTFTWDAGVGVERYALWIGNTQGGNDIYNKDSNGALSLTVTNLPTDGRTLYVSLWSMINGSWGNNVRYYTYKAKQ